MIRNYFTALAVALAFVFEASAQEYRGPELTPEFVCDLGQITPKNVKVKGSTQGLAIWGKYGFVFHDKGQCVVINLKKNEFVSSFKLKGNTSHCNNASFGVEKGTMFPLLYISGCKGDHCCYVTDITLDGGTIVQKLFHTGEGYTGSFDWFIDRKNKIIYTYGSSGEMSEINPTVSFKKSHISSKCLFYLFRRNSVNDGGITRICLGQKLVPIIREDIFSRLLWLRDHGRRLRHRRKMMRLESGGFLCLPPAASDHHQGAKRDQ